MRQLGLLRYGFQDFNGTTDENNLTNLRNYDHGLSASSNKTIEGFILIKIVQRKADRVNKIVQFILELASAM